MNNYKSFFEQFDTKVVDEIIEFGKRLSATKADVYLLMARKAACLVHCLEEMNLITLDGYVTSERVLDMDTEWLAGKEVIIIDDTIISGTTLFTTITQLKKIGVGKIKVYVLSVNSQHFVPELLHDDEGKSHLQQPYLILDNAECIKTCSDIVNAISIFPRPYDIDFPYYNLINLEEDQYHKLIYLSNWFIDETTSYVQNDHDTFSLSFTPSESLQAKFNNLIGFNISEFAMLKVRTYGDKTTRKKTSYKIRILPIVVFKPFDIKSVDLLFEKLIQMKGIDAELMSRHFITPTSKLRLLQYVIASKLADFWMSSEYVPHNLNQRHDLFTMRLLFNQHTLANIFKILASKEDPIFQEVEGLTEFEVPADKKYEPRFDLEDNSLESLQVLLIEPFLRLYYEKERKAWELVEKYKKDVFLLPAYRTIINRLKMGYSISFLKQLLKKFDGFNLDKVISSFLDKAIDAGIAVPIIVCDDGAIYRAYRHGEDVPFGEKEEKLFMVLLEAFCKGAKQAELPHLVVEKLGVLLIKIGIQNKFLNPITSNIPGRDSITSKQGNIRTVASVKTYLYGPVLVVKQYQPGEKLDAKPYLETTDDNFWLTKVMLRKGFLKKEKDKNKYQMAGSPGFKLDKALEGKVKNIGLIFGRLAKDQIIDDENDFVKLTACIYPHDIVSALAAEINIFDKRWAWYLERYESKHDVPANFLDLAERLRRQNNLFFTAINSGQQKFFWFLDREAQGLIAKVEDELDDDIYKNIWNEFWSPNKEWSRESIGDELHKLIIDEGLWLISIGIYIRMLDVCLRKDVPTETELETKNNQKFIARLEHELTVYRDKTEGFRDVSKTREIIPYLIGFIKYHKTYSSEKLTLVRNEIIDKIFKLTYRAKNILENAELQVDKFGKVQEIKRYSHVLFIDIKDIGTEVCRTIWYSIETYIDNYKTKLASSENPNDFMITIPADMNILDRGLWLAASGNARSKLLVDLADGLLNKFGAVVQMRCVLFTQVSEDYRIKIAGDNNTNIKSGYFWNQVDNLAEHFIAPITDHSTLTTILEKKEILIDEFSKLTPGQQSLYRAPETVSFTTEEYIPLAYSINTYNFMEDQKSNTADIGIITVVTEQTKAILAKFNKQATDDKVIKGRSYYEGWFNSLDNSLHKVVMTAQLQQGNNSAANAYNALVRDYHPKLIILIDIAGSIHKDLKIDDVVIANQVIYYESRKEVAGKTNHRGEIYKLNAKLKQLVNKFFLQHDEPAEFEAAENSYAKTFTCMQGPIGTGEAVIADAASKIKDWLIEVNSKTVAIEMEAGGFMQAFYEDELTDEQPEYGALVIRGISDHANVDKDDKWRKPAAANALKVLTELLKLLPVTFS